MAFVHLFYQSFTLVCCNIICSHQVQKVFRIEKCTGERKLRELCTKAMHLIYFVHFTHNRHKPWIILQWSSDTLTAIFIKKVTRVAHLGNAHNLFVHSTHNGHKLWITLQWSSDTSTAIFIIKVA